jgi:small subunit ribosomal protein S18
MAFRERDRRGTRGGRGGRVRHNRHICAFCVDKTEIDYKNAELLRGFLTPRGHILPRRRTGTCAKHQRRLTRAIKRGRHLALLPHAPQHTYEA